MAVVLLGLTVMDAAVEMQREVCESGPKIAKDPCGEKSAAFRFAAEPTPLCIDRSTPIVCHLDEQMSRSSNTD